MKMNPVLLRSCCALAGTMWAAAAAAGTYDVSSLPDLQARLNTALAGDVIVVHNGVYTTSAAITVSRQGTAAQPIRVVAKTIGGVEITGSSNTYRYNTIVDSPGGELTLRHGNDCLVYGNYFRNTPGMRIFGDRHQIFSLGRAGRGRFPHAGQGAPAHPRPRQVATGEGRDTRLRGACVAFGGRTWTTS